MERVDWGSVNPADLDPVGRFYLFCVGLSNFTC